MSLDIAGLERTSEHNTRTNKPRSVHRVLRSGSDIVNAILRSERSRSPPVRRSISSSSRLHRFSALLHDYSFTPTTFNREKVRSAWHSRTSKEAAPDSTYEEPEPSPFDDMVELQAAGLTGDSCSTEKDCKGKRVCVGDNGACRGRDGCHCIPPVPVVCSSASDCVLGEVCVYSEHFPEDYCVSEQFDKDRDDSSEVGAVPSFRPVVVVPAPVEADGEGGLTADPCDVRDDCRGDRICLSIDTLTECEEPGDCVCFPPVALRCSETDQCPLGEACASSLESDDICLSKLFVEDNADVFEAGPAPSAEFDMMPSPEMEAPNRKSGKKEPGLAPTPEATDLSLFPRGLTGDSCTTDKDCRVQRSCLHVQKRCAMDGGCICSPRKLRGCRGSADCADGEVCVETLDELFCMSEVVVLRSGLEDRVVEDSPSPSLLPESTERTFQRR